MREFISQINADMKKVKPTIFDVYKLAFDAHFVLRDIHPFGDGNSRMARLLMNYIQHYFSFPVTPVRATERKGYIHAFYE
ncbi:MAG: cell filamentation protein Fic, partial [Candidatus Nephrothrix sp. EaCA]